jgi:hypothetical protein
MIQWVAKAEEQSVGEAESTARATARGWGESPTLRLTLIFALVLLLVGVAGAGALALLRHAMRTPAADDVAQIICTAYENQDYGLMLDQIDPKPIPPNNVGTFDSAAQDALQGTLHGVDASYGRVTACKYTHQAFANPPDRTRREYSFEMDRTKGRKQATFTTLLTIIQQPDGQWKVTRDSNIIGAPAP